MNTMQLTFRILFISLLIFCPSNALAQNYFSCAKSSPQGAAKLKQVAENFSKISSIKATFEQKSILLGLRHSANSKGTLVFKRPGKMDWEYLDPEQQRFVTDSKTVWFYQNSLNQVTIAAFKESFNSELPVSFLMGISDLNTSFKIAKSCSTSNGWVFELEPKLPDPSLSRFVLLWDKNEKTPKAVKMTDVGGNDTEIILNDIQTDVELSDERFAYVIPKGVDIIDRRTK